VTGRPAADSVPEENPEPDAMATVFCAPGWQPARTRIASLNGGMKFFSSRLVPRLMKGRARDSGGIKALSGSPDSPKTL
jgi:hypothetical protein